MTFALDRPNDPETDVESHVLDGNAAAQIATSAGRLLCELRDGFDGNDPAELKGLGDRASHDCIVAELTRRFPRDAILSEEGVDDPRRLAASRVWIVDPLDGTREYAEVDRVDWAVHVALACSGQVVAGAVALPALGRTFSTSAAPSMSLPSTGPCRMVVSRTRPPEHAERLAERLNGTLVPMGSAGAKAMAVVVGEADVYAHAGGQFEWDSAAPVAVAAAVGLHVSRLDGSALVYNRADPWLPDVLICRPELAGAVMDVLGETP